jgi:CheY-like chemotaxis protein
MLEHVTRWVTGQRPARVLIAEDDHEMRKLLAQIIRAEGHTVIEAADGHRLLALLQSMVVSPETSMPDLIVSDIRMPGYTGLDLLAAVREADIDIPVMLITAFGDAKTHTEAFELGAAILDKPFSLDDFRKTVALLVG